MHSFVVTYQSMSLSIDIRINFQFQAHFMGLVDLALARALSSALQKPLPIFFHIALIYSRFLFGGGDDDGFGN